MKSSLWPHFFELEMLLWRASGVSGVSRGVRKYCRAFTHAFIFLELIKSLSLEIHLSQVVENANQIWRLIGLPEK